jgi:hypothetical protein
VTFVNMYPPTSDYPRFSTAQQLRDWVNTIFIPEKVKEAKFAELMKVEAFAPFMVEWEVFLNGQTSLFCATAPCLGKPAQIALAQELLNAIATAVRPHFTGALVAYSYQSYNIHGTEWNALDFSAFDDVQFSLNPKCAVAETQKSIVAQLDEYYALQLAQIATVMSHAPRARWGIGEFFATPLGFAICGAGSTAAFQLIEDMVYQKGLAAIDALGASGPRGIGFDDDFILTAAARNRVKAYMAAH